MTVVATEDFSGAAGTKLRGKTTTTGGQVWAVSAAYQPTRDGTILNGNGGCSTDGGLIPVLLSVNAGSADHYAQVRQTGVVNAGSLSDKVVCAAVAAVDYQNFIALAPYYGNNQMRLLKSVAGTQTIVALITGLSLAAGDVYRLERAGSTVKAFQNGVAIGAAEGYTIDDAVFAGATSVGLYLGKAPQDGAFDDFEAGVLGGGGGGTLTLTTGPASYAVLQRSRTGGAKTVSLGGTYTGTAPADLQWSLETEAATPVPGYDWAMITGATIGGGTWSASVAVPPDTARAGYRVNVRSRDAGGATIATTTTNAFTVGVLVEAAGQSNMQGQFIGSATAPGLSGKCARWDGQQWVRASNVGFTAAASAMSDLLSLPVGFATTAVSASGARSHAPAHTSTDGAVAAGQYWSSFTTLLAAWGGDLEAVIWYQGEANVGGDRQQYKDAVNARIAGVKAATGRTGAGEFSFGIVVIGRNPGSSMGTAALWDAIRQAQAEVAAETVGAFVAADAITLDMADSLHLAAAEYVQLAYAEGRSLAQARGAATYDGRGPRVLSAASAGSAVTVSFNLNGATTLSGGAGALTGWEFYNGSAWVAATDAAIAGNTVTFTAPGATQVRYLYGQDPAVGNVVRGDVKAAAAATSALPAEPTRGPVAVLVGDTAPPVLTGAITLGTKTFDRIDVSCPAASDNVAVTAYQWSRDGGATWVFGGTAHSFTGLQPLTAYDIRVRARDAAGNVSTHLALTTSTFRDGATGQWILDHPGSFMAQCVQAGEEDDWFDWELVTPPATGAWTDGPYADGTGVFQGPDATSTVIHLRKNGVGVGDFTVFLYDATTSATASQGGAWSVRQRVAGTQASAWSVRNPATSAQAGAWSVLAPGVTVVSATQSGAWSVLGALRAFSSELRTVRIYSDGAGLLGKFTMQPGEVLDFCYDFQPWLDDCGDSIASADGFTITPDTASMQVLETDRIGGQIVGFVQATEHGLTHKLTGRIHTVGGRTKEADIQIRIKEV